MLRAVLTFFLLTNAPADAGERILETRECTHPEVIKRLLAELDKAESSGETVDPLGDWHQCKVVETVSGLEVGEFHVKDEGNQIYRLFYEEDKEDKPVIFLQKIRLLPDFELFGDSVPV